MLGLYYQGSYFGPANGEFRRPKDSKKIEFAGLENLFAGRWSFTANLFSWGYSRRFKNKLFKNKYIPKLLNLEISKNRLRRYTVSTFRVFHSLLFLLHFWPFAEFFTLFFFSACVIPKNLVVPQVLKWLLYHHKFPKILLNLAFVTLDFLLKTGRF